jgi:hypothetical protein
VSSVKLFKTKIFQADSDGSRSGSSLSLRTMLPQSAAGSGAGAGANHNGSSAHPPQVSSGRSGVERPSDSNHRGVQRSISASASSKTRKGSTSTEPNTSVIGEFLKMFWRIMTILIAFR